MPYKDLNSPAAKASKIRRDAKYRSKHRKLCAFRSKLSSYRAYQAQVSA